ncbi:MAG: hypothetical protein SFV55_17900 [Haliscomenobacter sp.]|uniref:NACHT domain-containing protein n=1 Tax=Haliscomenobacter sp. TaxID=2717303 RepID=UPI0029BEDD5C|nr:hypothetical protein [Haliscomenobacter sp.]MDX2070307.1 hypothetical protein [Haliscomenobacter sp.]
MLKLLRKIAPFLILSSFLILSALLPEILGEDAGPLSKNHLGEHYKYILIAFFLLLFFFAAYISPGIGIGLFSEQSKSKPERYHLPATEQNRHLLAKAKKAISKADYDQALKSLDELHVQTLDVEISSLSARLAQVQHAEIYGTQSPQSKSRALNKISLGLLTLIKILEKEIAQAFIFYDEIKAALKTRYENRLKQKLTHRQPVNLRLLPSTTGTSSQAAETFVQYNDGQIRKKLLEYYEDAKGRLFLVGVPGAGKTTLLLQLELELLEKEPTRIPVILNLARWNSAFPSLEAWIQEILPSEMSLTINKKAAAELVAQNRLILLLDGLDEVKAEDRQTCLEAIGRYGGEDPHRYFILSSRIDEYQALAKDAPVNSQVEVGPLSYGQLLEQLQKIDPNEGSQRLLIALEQDLLLREIAEIPFYFNTLQLLFARGKYLHELNFSALDLAGRKKEIEQRFVAEMFRNFSTKDYNAHLASKYLGFFASRLKREKLVDFELIHLQYGWFRLSRKERIVSTFFSHLVYFFTVGLFSGIFGGLGSFLGAALFGSFLVQRNEGKGMFGGIIGALSAYLTQPFFEVSLNKLDGDGDLIRNPLIWLSIGLFGGLLGVLLGGLSGLLSTESRHWFPYIKTREKVKWDWVNNIDKSLGGVLAVGILGILIGAFKGALMFGLSVGLIVGLIMAFIVELIVQGQENSSYFIQINAPYQRFKASAKVLYFSIIQHWHLCYLLHKKGLFPKKVVPFLNHMVECNILETSGANWRFRHRILQHYFLDQWVETEHNPVVVASIS